ncbi:MAG TPA: MFS transporter [bacterium]|jgi:MFS family permease
MDLAQDARRITRTLFTAQGLASAAKVAMYPVMTIIGARLSGRLSWAGVPAMVYLLGQAFSAYGWGFLMDRLGRRPALVLGLLSGAAGGAVALFSIEHQSFGLFLVGSLLIGFAISAVQLARFVAAEVHLAAERGRAISNVVLGGAVGAIFGPILAGASGALAKVTALQELGGPFLVTTALFAVGSLLVFAFLRPEPRTLSDAIVAANPDLVVAGRQRTVGEIFRAPAAIVALAAMVLGQLVMQMLMVITPLHMRLHEHHISSISVVISVHAVGMYAFSIFSGRLADRLGRGPVIFAGGVGLILASLSARLSPQVLPLSAALFLLGLGWNFCYVAGSSLLADQLMPAERGRTQGFSDLLIGLTSAAGSLGSGMIFAAVGYDTMTMVAAAVAVLPLALTAWWQIHTRPVPVAS